MTLVPVQTEVLSIIWLPGFTFEQMLKAGGFDRPHNSISSQYFPGEGTETYVVPVEKKIAFTFFGREVTKAELASYIEDKAGRSLCGPTDALVVGMQHKEFQRTHPSVFPAQSLKEDHFIGLFGCSKERRIGLTAYFGGGFASGLWFAISE